MTDQIEQIVTALTGCCAECADRAEHIAWAIHEHGLLATPEHDREVAAKALRDAATALYGDDRANGEYSHPLSVASWLRDRAGGIEAGESDADA